MSGDRPSRPQLELLSDLRVDRQERGAPPAAPEPVRPPAPVAVPAFELRVTPLSWSLPRLGLLPDGTGLALSGGPVRMAVRLR